jgi:hypothetical protein
LSVENAGSNARLVWVTSSMMPTVNRCAGRRRASSKTAFDHRRGELLAAEPYRPPMIAGVLPSTQLSSASATAPRARPGGAARRAPGSFVRSSTTTVRVLGGSAASSASWERPVEADDRDADPLAEPAQLVHGLLHGAGARAHQHDHSIGVGRPW